MQGRDYTWGKFKVKHEYMFLSVCYAFIFSFMVSGEKP